MSNKVLAVCVSATKHYLYAWNQCIQAISAAVEHYESGHFIYACDESKECKAAGEFLKNTLPENWKIHTIIHKFDDDKSENYKVDAQLRIAKLQGSTFAKARQIKADLCWSVESDVLVPPDALKVLEWTLNMPKADGSPVYDIASGTYPNASFLLGFGTPQNPIAECFLPSERKVPARLLNLYNKCKEKIDNLYKSKIKDGMTPESIKDNQKLIDKEQKRFARINEKIKACPPDGNIWEVIAKHGWRRRGWLDNAMPATLAQVFQADWCGLGVALMSKNALALADFNGYDGKGTQDLFLCWKRWYPNNLKIAGVPHILCDHIKRRKDKDDTGKEIERIEHLIAFRETEGEYQGHLRVKSQDWIPI